MTPVLARTNGSRPATRPLQRPQHTPAAAQARGGPSSPAHVHTAPHKFIGRGVQICVCLQYISRSDAVPFLC